MNNTLLEYYERELAYFRKQGAAFAEEFPRVASQLLIEKDRCLDPHTERLIEAAAFMAGRVRLKLDDEYPEIVESYLNTVYPHYLNPIPSMSVVQLGFDPSQAMLNNGFTVEKGHLLFSRPVQGVHCTFRTCYPTTIWPLEISHTSIQSTSPINNAGLWSEATLRLSLRCQNTTLSQLKSGDADQLQSINKLRFYLDGDSKLIYSLYEMIFNHTLNVELRSNSEGAPVSLILPNTIIKPVGFEKDEGLLPYTDRSFLGYRLLTEYFTFPNKFLFFDVIGIDEAVKAGFEEEFDIIFHLRDVKPPTLDITKDTFRLGCTPIINLFSKITEPVRLSQKKHEYQVIPDIHRQDATEIYSIDKVTSINTYLESTREYFPFYAFKHSQGQKDTESYWYASRKPSERQGDAGSNTYMTFVDLAFNPRLPASEVLTIHATCTNRDLPAKLPIEGKEGEFVLDGAASLCKVRCLRKPTPTYRPPLRKGSQWRILSHLQLNIVSINGMDGNSSPEALREMLLLYDFTNSYATRKQINGIDSVKSKKVTRTVAPYFDIGFIRGVETTLEFDETQFLDSSAYLFAAVIERFLALYSSMNSFSQLIAKFKQQERSFKRWQPRVGEQIVL